LKVQRGRKGRRDELHMGAGLEEKSLPQLLLLLQLVLMPLLLLLLLLLMLLVLLL
jgi:hypothetical protein